MARGPLATCWDRTVGRPRPWLPPLWQWVLLLVPVYFVGLGVRDALTMYLTAPKVADFSQYRVAAQVGMRWGWAAVYDPDVFRPAYVDSLQVAYKQYGNPPILAWLVLPTNALPYQLALTIWMALAAASLCLTWWLCAPSRKRWEGLTWLALLVSLPAASEMVKLGQATWLALLSVATAWWLLERNRQWWAGLALIVGLVKPQLIWLVPLTLLVAGYRRCFVAWLAGAAAVAAVSFAALGLDGVRQYAATAATLPSEPVTLFRALGGGAAGAAASAACVVLGLAAARRQAGGPAGPVVAAGLIASLAASPYGHVYDLVMLMLAAWLAVRHHAMATGVVLWLAGCWLALLVANVTATPELVACVLSLFLLALTEPPEQKQNAGFTKHSKALTVSGPLQSKAP